MDPLGFEPRSSISRVLKGPSVNAVNIASDSKVHVGSYLPVD